MANKKALLIIDMQKGSFIPETPRFDTSGVVNRINQLSRRFRAIDNPVIFIQHNGSQTQEFIPHTSQWELLDELEVKSSDILIDKTANDAFYKTKLSSALLKLKVKDLWITGCATDFCVEATIQSALVKDYIVTVVANGHTTGDRPHLKATQIIEHYNWVWQEMTHTHGSVRVESYVSLKEELETANNHML